MRAVGRRPEKRALTVGGAAQACGLNGVVEDLPCTRSAFVAGHRLVIIGGLRRLAIGGRRILIVGRRRIPTFDGGPILVVGCLPSARQCPKLPSQPPDHHCAACFHATSRLVVVGCLRRTLRSRDRIDSAKGHGEISHLEQVRVASCARGRCAPPQPRSRLHLPAVGSVL